jgi:hypothetical protein
MRVIPFILIFLPFIAMAQLKPIAELEFGYADKVVRLTELNHISPKINKQSTYTNIVIGATWKGIEATFENETYIDFNEGTFKPWLADYTFNLNYEYKGIVLGYKHNCIHMIKNRTNYYENVIYSGGYDKFYLKYKFF